MMLRAARAAMFAVLPAEVLLTILLLSGISLPVPVIAAAELAVVVVFALELAAGFPVYRAGRRRGASRRDAVAAAVRQLVPGQVRRIMGFDMKGMVSLGLWVTRRRNGVPDGATALSYTREQTPAFAVLLVVMAIEAVAAELLLRAFHAPHGLHVLILAVDGYGFLVGLAVVAACVTRPHVVSGGELRVRYGAFFDVRIPRALIASARLARNYNESGMVSVQDGRLAVAVSSQTNVIVELTEPVTVIRPLGRCVEATTIRFFADDPAAAVGALTSAAAVSR